MFALSDEGPDHHAYVIKGDTTVGINTYKKVYRRKINSDATILADFMPPYYFSDEKLIGAIRDDLPEKTVYGIGFVADAWYLDTCDVLEEQLLYDYSVSVGEEVIGCLNTADALPNAVVDSIKTEIHFGEEHTVLYTTYGELIVGIGTWMGLFIPIYSLPAPGNPMVLVDYCVGTDDDCGFFATATDERPFETLARLYPNPASQYVVLEFTEPIPKGARISIQGLDGKVFKTLNIEAWSENVVFDVSSLPSAWYSVTIESLDFRTTARFFVGK